MNSAITAEVANVVDAAPAALDTLNELAAALGDDANFASTVTTSLADKASQVDLTAETTRATSAETINNQAIAILQNQVSGISTSSGSTDIEMQANVDMATNKISNLGTPTSGTDAATKAYVDSAVSSADVDLSGYSTTAEMNTAIDNVTVDLSGYSTTSEMNSAITAEVANVVDAAPAALDTLNELAAALGDDANFASTVTTSLATKADDAATTAALATKADASAVATSAQGALADTAIQPVDLTTGFGTNTVTSSDWSANGTFSAGTLGLTITDNMIGSQYGADATRMRTNDSTHFSIYAQGKVSGIQTKTIQVLDKDLNKVWDVNVGDDDPTMVMDETYAAWIKASTDTAYIHNLSDGSLVNSFPVTSGNYNVAHAIYGTKFLTAYINQMYIYDIATGNLDATIALPGSATNANSNEGHKLRKILVQGNKAFISDFFYGAASNSMVPDGAVYVVDLSTNTVVQTITAPGVSQRKFGGQMAIDRTLNHLAVTRYHAAPAGDNYNDSQGAIVEVFSTEDYSHIATINTTQYDAAKPHMSSYLAVRGGRIFIGADNSVQSKTIKAYNISDGQQSGTFACFENGNVEVIIVGDTLITYSQKRFFSSVAQTGTTTTSFVVDDSLFATKAYVDSGVAGVDLSGYSTTSEMNTAISAIPSTDLTPYSTSTEMTSAIATAKTEAQTYADQVVASTVDAAPAALDTLNELAAALGDDANFASTVTSSIATKADDAATTAALATKSDQTDLDTLESLIKGQDVVGTSILISAPYAEHSDGTQRAGQTYLYNAADTSSPVLTIESADPREWMAQGSNDKPYSTTINQYGFVAIGDHNYTGGGRVSIFNPDGSLLQNLLPSSPNSSLNENFGKTVVWSESGDRLFVAAKNEDSNAASGDKVEGAIYAYTVNYSNDNQNLNFSSPTKLSPSRNFNALGGNQWFGENNSSIVSVGRKLYVGFVSYDGSTQNQGRVYIYNIDDLNASPTEIATQSNTHGNSFGSSVAANSTHWAAVAYSGASGTPEVIHIFNSSNNQLIGTIQKPNIETNDNWIQYIEMTDSHIISIGAGLSGSDNNGMYVWPLSSISSQPTYVARYGSSSDGFNVHAKSVSAKGNIILLGYHEFNDGNVNGQLHIYDVNDLSTPQKVLNQPFSTINESRFGMSASIGYTMTSPAAALETVATEITPAINELRSEISALSGTDTSLTDSISANASAIAAETAARTAAIAAIPSTDLSDYSTTAEMNTAITAEVANVVDAAPAALDTLNELAAALGDDANFASTVTTSLASKADDAATTAALATKADGAATTTALATKADVTTVTAIEDFLNGNVSDVTPEAVPLTKISPISSGSSHSDRFGSNMIITNDYVIVAADNYGSDQHGQVFVYDKNNTESVPSVIEMQNESSLINTQYGPSFGENMVWSENTKTLACSWSTSVSSSNTGGIQFFDVTDRNNISMKHQYLGSTDDKLKVRANTDGKFIATSKTNVSGSQLLLWDENSLSASPTVFVSPTGVSWGKRVVAGEGRMYVFEQATSTWYEYDVATLTLQSTITNSGNSYYGVIGGGKFISWSPNTIANVYEFGSNVRTAIDLGGNPSNALHATSSHLYIGSIKSDQYGALGTDEGVLKVYDLSDLNATPVTISTAQSFYGYFGGITADDETLYITEYDGSGSSSPKGINRWDVSSLAGGFSLQSDLESLVSVETSAREIAIAAETSARETAITSAISTASADATSKADQAEVDAKAYADQVVAATVDAAPAALDTLNELAAALGDDANFASTVTTSLASKADDAATTTALDGKATTAQGAKADTAVQPEDFWSLADGSTTTYTVDWSATDYQPDSGKQTQSFYKRDDIDDIRDAVDVRTSPNGNVVAVFNNWVGSGIPSNTDISYTVRVYNASGVEIREYDMGSIVRQSNNDLYGALSIGEKLVSAEITDTHVFIAYSYSSNGAGYKVYSIDDLDTAIGGHRSHSKLFTVDYNTITAGGNQNGVYAFIRSVGNDKLIVTNQSNYGSRGEFGATNWVTQEEISLPWLPVVNPQYISCDVHSASGWVYVAGRMQSDPNIRGYNFDTGATHVIPYSTFGHWLKGPNPGTQGDVSSKTVSVGSKYIVIVDSNSNAGHDYPDSYGDNPALVYEVGTDNLVATIPRPSSVMRWGASPTQTVTATNGDAVIIPGSNVGDYNNKKAYIFDMASSDKTVATNSWDLEQGVSSGNKSYTYIDVSDNHEILVAEHKGVWKSDGPTVAINTPSVDASTIASKVYVDNVVAATDGRTAGISVDSDSNIALSVGIEMGQNNIKDVNDVYANRGFIDTIESNDLKVQTGTVDFEGSIVNFGSSTIIGSGFGTATKAEVDAHLNKSTANTGEFVKWNGTDYEWTELLSGRLATDQLQVASGGSISITGPGGTFDFQDGIVILSGSDVRVDTPTDVGQAANKGYVDGVVAATVDAAPAALDTLNELAAALGDDANFASTITNSLATKANTADVATAAQGAKADSALQPGDAVSLTVDNSEKLDGQQSSHFRIDIYDINGNIVN